MIHDGHRERLKAKFRNDPKSLEDHEMLELMLFNALPRVNTNEIAHYLIERFGSIRGVMNASIIELTQIKGIGENSALLIKETAELVSRYALSSVDYKKTPLESYNTLVPYLTALFIGADVERCYLVLFDRSKRLISVNLLAGGNANRAIIDMTKIAELVANRRTRYVVLAHNHPYGNTSASGDDIQTTNKIKHFLASMDIELIDHFIIADNNCKPILREEEYYIKGAHYKQNSNKTKS